MSDAELSIVMPVFKEGEAIVPAVEALERDIRTSHEILVVYDFDEDPTVPVIDRRRLNAGQEGPVPVGCALEQVQGVPLAQRRHAVEQERPTVSIGCEKSRR